MKKKPAIKIKTVQELIDALMKIENKDLKIYLESNEGELHYIKGINDYNDEISLEAI